jgi:hypothetical protein
VAAVNQCELHLLKRCACCKAEKPRAEFYRGRGWRDGLHPYCKVCDLVYCRERRQAHLAKSPGRWRWKRDLVRHDYFASVQQPIQAYVLGFLAADGNVLAAQHRVTIEVAVADEPLLALIRDELVPTGSITHRCRDSRQSATLAFVSRRMTDDLAVYGITPVKSRTLRWPRMLPQRLTPSFILGYFDGDGFITSHNRANGPYPYLGFTSGSPEFLVAIARVIKECCGVAIGGPWRKGTSNCYAIRAAGRDARIIDDWLHQDGIGLARKRIPAPRAAAG